MKDLKNDFFKKGYVIVNFFSKKEIQDLLAKVESYYLKLAKTKKVLIPSLKEYHKIEISEKIHKSLMHPNQRQIKIPNKINLHELGGALALREALSVSVFFLLIQIRLYLR